MNRVERLVFNNLSAGLRIETHGGEVKNISARSFDLYSNQTIGGGVEVRNSRLSSIRALESDIRGEIAIYNTIGAELRLGKSRAGVLRVSDSNFTGDINFWGANIGQSFIKGTSAKNLLAWYTNLGSIEIVGRQGDEGRRPSVFNDVILNRASIGSFQLSNAQARDLRLKNLKGNLVSLNCLSVGGTIDLTSASVDSFWSERVDAGTVDLEAAHVREVWFSRPVLTTEQVASGQEGDETNQAPEGPWDTQFCQGTSNTPRGDFGRVNLEGTHADTLILNGMIEEQLVMRLAKIGRMTFSGDRSGFRSGANWSLRGASVDSIAMPHDALQSDPSDKTTLLDIDGAQIGFMRIYDPCRDRSIYETGDDELHLDDCEVAQDYSAFLDKQLLPSLGLTEGDHSTSDYRGADYAFLRRSMEDAGKPQLAQRVSVLQNDHYAAVLAKDGAWGTVMLYRLGAFINEYGYNNGRAIGLLIALWSIGFLVLFLESPSRRFWWKSQPHRSRFIDWISRRSPRSIAVRQPNSEFGDLPWWEAAFLSVDRIIPTMVLDEDFGRPEKSKHSKRAANGGSATSKYVRRHGVVIAVLYLQRLMAFIIVLFMLGGVLDVFQ